MKPLLLKGHTRPLTQVRFNREGDLVFTCAKDKSANVWYTDNGERLGTYDGHEGTVWDCDVNFTSEFLLTGSADKSVRLWNVSNGREIYSYPHDAGIRCVRFATGDSMFLSVQDTTFGQQPCIFIRNLPKATDGQFDPQELSEMEAPLRQLYDTESYDNGIKSHGKICCAEFTSLNRYVVAACDDGSIRKWDIETGAQVDMKIEHKKQINDLQFSKDKTMMITSSSDHTAKVWDVKTFELLKTIQSNRPVNSASFSPQFNQIILGGGQEAMDVTTTSAKVGHFEVDFHHLVFEDFLCSVKGHFGPVNTVGFNPNGSGFISGAEDGYLRMLTFNKDYFSQSQRYNWEKLG